jgi:hypothetical protein
MYIYIYTYLYLTAFAEILFYIDMNKESLKFQLFNRTYTYALYYPVLPLQFSNFRQKYSQKILKTLEFSEFSKEKKKYAL